MWDKFYVVHYNKKICRKNKIYMRTFLFNTEHTGNIFTLRRVKALSKVGKDFKLEMWNVGQSIQS
jgi:hypothetical protein